MRKLLSDYGMLWMLALLCGLFSVLTLKEQQPRGAVAAEQIAAELGRAADCPLPKLRPAT